MNPTLLQSFFLKQEGRLPKGLYLVPILLWAVGLSVLGLPQSYATTTGFTQNTAEISTYAVDLQQDINFMSAQVKGMQVFELSKKQMISDSRQDNFLLEKARRKLEKSPMAQSEGQLDGEQLVFDSALNAMVVPKIVPQQLPLALVDSIQYSNGNSSLRQEASRKDRMAQAKTDNRQRRLALESEHIDYAAQAYEQGVIDQNRRYNQFHGTTNGTDYKPQQISSKSASKSASSRSSKKRSSSSNQTTSKASQAALSFNTATGQKNSFVNSINNNSNSDKRGKSVRYSPTPSNQISNRTSGNPMNNPLNNPLVATIDKADKVRSGDKVQIRILQDGIYRGIAIPQDVILYGICRVNQNRIDITVPSIAINGQLIRTNLVAYDMDGIKGIYVDGTFNNFTKDIVQEGLTASNAISGNGLGVRNPLGNVSLKLGRKANNRNRVHIPSAYQILLYDGAPNELNEVNENTSSFSNY